MIKICITRLTFVLALSSGLQYSAIGQGRVVINEFMAWSGCNTTSEFVELMNFGPGPMNIGCYIVTNGNYSVTVPPNTILQPGQYYLLSGQDILANDCGNRDSAVHVDLNWSTCNCTDKPIPTTGDGFMDNGGSANEKMVLLDPNLTIIDAASRLSTPSSSVSITTPGLSGSCTSRTFNLATMSINYETIGQSTGIDNSFARRVDGDCGWVKTTAISAHAPNKTNSTASASYNFTTVSTNDCNQSTGSISISVSASNVSSLFPMSYTLAHDVDQNWLFNSDDVYTSGIDNTSPNIDINNLPYGRYRITVASSLGCNLQSFDFFIYNCYTVLLPIKLIAFDYAGIKNDAYVFQCRIAGADQLKTLVLEGKSGATYTPLKSINNPGVVAQNGVITVEVPVSNFQSFRLRLVDKKEAVSYSQVVSIGGGSTSKNNFWPNPVVNKLHLEFMSSQNGPGSYSINNLNGTIVRQETLLLKKGKNNISLALNTLPAGIYHLSIPQTNQKEPIYFRFVKQ